MNVLVDTSIWIEFFRPHPGISQESIGFLELLLEDDRAATIHPIGAELLSGKIDAGKKKQIVGAVEVMKHIDPDWNARDVWKRIAEMAGIAHGKLFPVPGIVDRMILVAAERAGASLWTLDRAMLKLASVLNVPVLYPYP